MHETRENHRGDMGKNERERDIGEELMHLLDLFTGVLGEHAGKRACLLLAAVVAAIAILKARRKSDG